jgi:hypothetical protein
MEARRPRASLRQRLGALDWQDLNAELEREGRALTPPLLDGAECAALSALFDDARRFRKRIDMGSHHYGEGEYRYFTYPLPRLVAALRRELYARLAPLANALAERLGRAERYPDALGAFLRRHCCCATRAAATTGCTRTATARSPSRCRWSPA